jgi:outer membrane protein
MKKSLVIIAIAFSIISCNKKAEVASTKTAYVDTSKLMMESTEAKYIEAKY